MIDLAKEDPYIEAEAGDRELGEEESAELDKAEAKTFRGLAARANYLALDRPGVQSAATDACRRMARPRRE